ncbi:MAG: DUF502 domain-containing protein [Deltaproteobacteria bacterium]|nr:DUF502 domain-containing protein [Deltaproteobacteria bacterium]
MAKSRTFRRVFLTGLIVILPIFISLWVIHFIFSLIDDTVTPLVLDLIRLLGLSGWVESAWVEYFAPVVSVMLSVLLIYLVGLVGGNVLGRQVLQFLDKLLMQVPFVRGIYSATRQFLDTFSRARGGAFRRVVLVEYPRQGLWTMGFVTSETKGEVQARTEGKVLNVFLPTTPNPTSGWLIFVREDEVVQLDMSVDEAIKMVISGGVVTPPHRPDASVRAVRASGSE